MAAISNQPVRSLRGVGPRLSEKLSEYGVQSVEDLLFHLPLRYQDRTRITPIGALQDGVEVVVEGEVKLADVVFGRRRSLVVRLQDGSGTLTLRFFHFSAAQRNNLQPGTRLRCFGQARRGGSGIEMYHPEYLECTANNTEVEQALTPVYPTTDGISQNQWRKLCNQAVDILLKEQPKDLLPPSEHPTLDLVSALQYLHHPPPDAAITLLREGEHPAQLRLALEELVAHNLSLQQLRDDQQRKPAPALAIDLEQRDQFLAALPFQPTGAQQRVIGEIATDLAKDKPMLRLLQGDVGSGKTLVAAAAALQSIGNGYQVAIMAPTEILAEQHRRNFAEWFAPYTIEQEWLSGRVKGKKRELALERISEGQAQLVIGTHALFSRGCQFRQARTGNRRRTTPVWCPPAPEFDRKSGRRIAASSAHNDRNPDSTHPVYGCLR